MLTLLGGTTAALATGLPSYGGRPRADDLEPGGAFDRFVAAQAASDAFSGTVVLTHHGRPVLARSYGLADKRRSVPNGPNTRFALASVTKLFTAVAVARLAQQGKVSYNATVGEFLSGFPAAIAGKVRVHQLLTHSSGIGDFFQSPGFWEKAATWTSREAVMDGITDLVRQSPPGFEPGTSWSYSNSGYHLLGEIIAQASGQSYYDFVRDQVFGQARLTGTGFFTKPQRLADARIARPYVLQPSGERIDVAQDLMFIGTPSGDAFSTCADLDRFLTALFKAKLLEPAFTQLTVSGKLPLPPPPPAPGGPPPGAKPPITFQAYGPLVSLVDGYSAIGHGGGSPSASTSVEHYPDLGWTAVILSNYGDAIRPVVSLARRLILASA
ncbi:class A beta-lactamase-related serine hydrolase [Kribbella antibiotica]|uniref:Class A beta-lactamase-related serine hydrolase n=2 Tax=Kribbella antibiotica TaxID=190195 RepID=A0A4R4YTT1_9ACTN|nr:class A beta-lactamase-related serine hydrolase [Kribbella antibiotica]